MLAYHFSTRSDIEELWPGTHYGSLRAALDRMRSLEAHWGTVYAVDLPPYERFAKGFPDNGCSHEGDELITIAEDFGLDLGSNYEHFNSKEVMSDLARRGLAGFTYINAVEDPGRISYCAFDWHQPVSACEVGMDLLDDLKNHPEIERDDARLERFVFGYAYKLQCA